MGDTIKRRRRTVLGGVAVLTTASLLVKVIGVLYKIPLTYLLGDEGMGYFNTAYTIYAWLYMLSTAGLPIAVSILISEADAAGDEARAARVMRTAACLLLAIGVATTACMLFFSRAIAILLGSREAAYCMTAIAPTLFFICVTSLFRGYFQGYQEMLPTALSQLIEAAGKLVLGMFFAERASAVGQPLPIVCAAAIFGVTVGTALGTLYLTIRFLVTRGRRGRASVGVGSASGDRVLPRLFRIALPVTVSASVMSMTGLIDLGMMIRRLTSVGYTAAEATALFGNYTTLVVPMFNLPSVLVAPIATGVIPALARARATGDAEGGRRLADGAFRYTALIAMPATLGLCAFARQILALLYPQESVQTAYRLLVYVSPAVYFLCILTVSNAVLQSSGHAGVPMLGMLLGGTVKTVLGYILMGRADIAVAGAPIGTVACYLIALLVNASAMGHRAHYLPRVKEILFLPLLASMLAVGGARLIYDRLLVSSGSLGTLTAIGLAAGVYLLVILRCGLVRPEELRLMRGRPVEERV